MTIIKTCQKFLHNNLKEISSVGVLAISNLIGGTDESFFSIANIGFNALTIGTAYCIPSLAKVTEQYIPEQYNDLLKITLSGIISGGIATSLNDNTDISVINTTLTSAALTAIWSDTGSNFLEKGLNYLEDLLNITYCPEDLVQMG